MASGTISKVQNESGNGYCEMPDGTLIQWGSFTATGNTSAYGNMFRVTASVNVLFPKSFIDDPTLVIQANNNAAGTVIYSIPSTSGITEVAWMRQSSATGASILFSYLAVGRWKA